MKQRSGIFSIFVLFIFLLSCTTTKMIPIQKVKVGRSIRIYLKNDSFKEGLLVNKNQEYIILVNIQNKEKEKIPLQTIRRIDYLNREFDYSGEEISEAEINKFKDNKYFMGYSIGGFVLGGLGGIVVGLPLWYAETGIKPLFTGGIGAIAGAIYFGHKGSNRDKERSIELIRLLRQRKQELKKRQQEELEKLEQLKKEKEKLQKKLQEKTRRKE